MHRGIASLLALVLTGPFLAQETPGPTRVRFRLPVTEHILDNGLKVLIVPRHDVPRVWCGLYWKVGSVNERPGITGLSHFFEHMMFKGTRTIGTTDWKRDEELNAVVEAGMDRVRSLKLERLEAERLGRALRDGWQVEYDSAMKSYEEAIAEQKKITISEHLSKLFQQHGGTGLNATTSYDRTNYFVELPANKVELFCWLEADRFAGPVFREFYPEREVVKEERRMRTDSTPTGLINVDFQAMFWQAHPYSWPVIGWMSDIDQYRLKDAEAYYRIHYSPRNCTAIFVGDVDVEEIKGLTTRYFSRLKNSEVPPDPIVTVEPRQTGVRRLTAEANANPFLLIAWHGPSQAHQDGTPLDVTMGILDGRTGRLWRSLVDEKKLALAVGAGYWGLKYGGMLRIWVQPRPDADFRAIEDAVQEVLDTLAKEGPAERELRKVKNQMIANAVRGLQTNEDVGNALGSADIIHDWRDVMDSLEWTERTAAADVKRLVAAYLGADGRNILTVQRKGK